MPRVISERSSGTTRGLRTDRCGER